MILAGAAAAGVGSLAAGSASAAGAGSSDVTPGVLGFVVIAAMGVALFFLMRSMAKHLRRVRSVRDAGLAPGSKIEAGMGGRTGRGRAGRPARHDAGETSGGADGGAEGA